VIYWIKILGPVQPTRHKIGYVRDVLLSQSLGLVLKKLHVGLLQQTKQQKQNCVNKSKTSCYITGSNGPNRRGVTPLMRLICYVRQIRRRRVYCPKGAGACPLKCPFLLGTGAPSNKWFLGPSTSLLSKGHLDRLSCFRGAHGHITPKRGIWHQKPQKKFPGATPPDPLSGRRRPPLAPTPSTAARCARGVSSPVAGT